MPPTPRQRGPRCVRHPGPGVRSHRRAPEGPAYGPRIQHNGVPAGPHRRATRDGTCDCVTQCRGLQRRRRVDEDSDEGAGPHAPWRVVPVARVHPHWSRRAGNRTGGGVVSASISAATSCPISEPDKAERRRTSTTTTHSDPPNHLARPAAGASPRLSRTPKGSGSVDRRRDRGSPAAVARVPRCQVPTRPRNGSGEPGSVRSIRPPAGR